jgi:hypothetical protein
MTAVSNCVAPEDCAADQVCVYGCHKGAAYARANYLAALEARLKNAPQTADKVREEIKRLHRPWYVRLVRALCRKG